MIGKLKKLKKDYKDLFMQTESFKNTYYNGLNNDNKNIIDAFCKIKNNTKLEKFRIIKKYKFYKQGFNRILAEFVFI